jgi:hypothetical protein
VIERGREPPELAWLGPTEVKARELLAAVPLLPAARPRDLAGEALTEFLQGGPHTSQEVWAMAQEHGFSERTMRRAKEDLETRSVRVWAGAQRLSYWLLPKQELPGDIPPEAVELDLEPWMPPLCAMYPRPLAPG